MLGLRKFADLLGLKLGLSKAMCPPGTAGAREGKRTSNPTGRPHQESQIVILEHT